jgi:hypothetical protein
MPGIFNHEDTDVRQIGGSGVERIAIICSGHANPRDLQTIFAPPVCAHNPHTKISTCDAATRGKRLARTSSATMRDAGGLRRQDCVRKWIGLDHPTFHWFDAPVRTFRVDSRVRASIYRLAMVLVSLLLDAALGLASAQTKLDAAYTATLWGLPVGHISWTVELSDNRFKAAARGAITGLLRIVADGRGDVAVHGAMSEGKPVPSLFSLNLIAGKWSDDVRIVFSGGKAQEHVAAAAVKANPDQVPLTDANRVGVVDPMTALLVHIPGAGAIAVPQACDRSVAVFDGHARYNLRLGFKRLDDVKTDEGYQGRAVVCSLKFVPVAGHDPKRYLVTYLAAQHDIEVWLAPLAGSRLLVPYRVTMPTPIGMGVLQATTFVSHPQKQTP